MQDSREENRLREHLKVLRRHKALIIFVIVLVTVAAATVTASGGERYRALAEVLLSRQDIANRLTDLSTPTPSTDFTRIAGTQAGIASSPRVARKALAISGVRNMTPSQLAENSSIVVKGSTDILIFTVEDRDAGKAAKLANAYAKAYVDYRRGLDTSPITEARTQAKARIKSLRKSGDRSTRLYSRLVEKDEQLSTAKALQGANATVIRAAQTAGQVAPRIRRNAALGGLVGLLLGVAAAFFIEALNTRVRSATEVKDALGLPLLGYIPPPSRELREAKDLVMVRSPHSQHAEVYRLLRTNLSFANLEANAKTILLTSALPAEGKSTTVANLAVTLARAGAQVVLVDLDLRRPTLATFFDLESHAGITDVALGSVTLEQALQPISLDVAREADDAPAFAARDVGALQVLTGGWIPPDIGEFVGGKALANILSQLRAQADFVLLDSPPLLSFGDALAIADNIDAVLIAARIDKLRRHVIRNLGDVLAALPVHKLGLIATGSQESITGYGYGYGYGYEYGYGYKAPESRRTVAKRGRSDREKVSAGS